MFMFMLMCGIYHPPRSKYQEDDLIEYIMDIVDQFLECHPSGLVLCGGDLNRLDLEKLSNLSGLRVHPRYDQAGAAQAI